MSTGMGLPQCKYYGSVKQRDSAALILHNMASNQMFKLHLIGKNGAHLKKNAAEFEHYANIYI